MPFGSWPYLILLAKSEIRTIHVWQAVENQVCRRAGRGENHFATSIKMAEEPLFVSLSSGGAFG
jgi:hypothetical protein